MAAVTEARAIFKMLDKNGDGTLSPLELSSKLSDFGIADEAIQSLFILLDRDGDGEVDPCSRLHRRTTAVTPRQHSHYELPHAAHPVAAHLQVDLDEFIAGYGAYQRVTGQKPPAKAKANKSAVAGMARAGAGTKGKLLPGGKKAKGGKKGSKAVGGKLGKKAAGANAKPAPERVWTAEDNFGCKIQAVWRGRQGRSMAAQQRARHDAMEAEMEQLEREALQHMVRPHCVPAW
jgi:hypothetical protein